jgi:hypothetical protein
MPINKIISLLATLWFAIGSDAIAESSQFAISDEPLNIQTPREYFGLTLRYAVNDGGIDQFRRDFQLKSPGIYYLWPRGAHKIELESTEFYEVLNWLKSNIEPAFYDLYVLMHLKGFYYELQGGSTKRREYHVRYVKSDTIFVISGWLGKFYCFYMATPTNEKYSVSHLQQKLKNICPDYVAGNDSLFRKQAETENYFLDYVDRDRMTRVRNFFVDEGLRPSEDGQRLIGSKYNVIEITKYIDKEAMP